MPNHLTTLGILHTAISILGLFAAFYALIKNGKINPLNGPGKLYIWLTIVACVSSLPIMKTGHPTAGHFVAVIILLLLPIAIYAKSLRIFGNKWEYVQIVLMSTTLFFSMIPSIVETLTRLPISHPLADDPNAPIVKMGLLILVVLFITGVIFQVLKLRSQRKLNSDTLVS